MWKSIDQDDWNPAAHSKYQLSSSMARYLTYEDRSKNFSQIKKEQIRHIEELAQSLAITGIEPLLLPKLRCQGFQMSCIEITSFPANLQKLFYHGPAVSINDDRTVFDLLRAHGFIVI